VDATVCGKMATERDFLERCNATLAENADYALQSGNHISLFPFSNFFSKLYMEEQF
jgi:hypothetical protein